MITEQHSEDVVEVGPLPWNQTNLSLSYELRMVFVVRMRVCVSGFDL